jgi:transposase
VSRWLKRAREGGVEALRHRPSPGPEPRLTVGQRQRLLEMLERGAEAYQFRGDVWTTKRVAAVIRQEFGVRYHPAHVSRVLRACGWSVQRPVKRASQRDEAAIRAWVEERWPALKRSAERADRTIVWVDESAFYLLPGLVRSYAPCGKTPVLRLPLTRDHLSAVSGLTLDGRLLLQVRPDSLRSPDVVEFLKQLLRHIQGKMLVIWDGAPIHRGQPVRDFLSRGAARRLQLEQLPAYAPELNPDEGVWNYLKRVELPNVRCQDLAHLEGEVRRAVKRLRHRRAVLRACVRACGYAV